MAELEIPVARVYVDQEAWVLVVVDCPYCGRRAHHRHGCGPHGSDPREYMGARTADCGGSPGCYELELVRELNLESSTPTLQERRAMQAAAHAVGLTFHEWRRQYGDRTAPLSSAELRARGDLARRCVG